MVASSSSSSILLEQSGPMRKNDSDNSAFWSERAHQLRVIGSSDRINSSTLVLEKLDDVLINAKHSNNKYGFVIGSSNNNTIKENEEDIERVIEMIERAMEKNKRIRIKELDFLKRRMIEQTRLLSSSVILRDDDVEEEESADFDDG